MDNLHDVLRSIRGETKAQPRDHVDVFREFLDHLDRASRRRPSPRPAKTVTPKERGRKR
jgi:hypothetical protein